MTRVRPALALDARSMADLLNDIIEAGGTTALTKTVSEEDMRASMAEDPERSAWHVALDAAERAVGFQWIEPHPTLQGNVAAISTFVQMGQTGLGIGSALFNATRKVAGDLGYSWINATIRADNTGGLTYYQSRGFRDWAHDENVVLDSGLVVHKISKRFDL